MTIRVMPSESCSVPTCQRSLVKDPLNVELLQEGLRRPPKVGLHVPVPTKLWKAEPFPEINHTS